MCIWWLIDILVQSEYRYIFFNLDKRASYLSNGALFIFHEFLFMAALKSKFHTTIIFLYHWMHEFDRENCSYANQGYLKPSVLLHAVQIKIFSPRLKTLSSFHQHYKRHLPWYSCHNLDITFNSSVVRLVKLVIVII